MREGPFFLIKFYKSIMEELNHWHQYFHKNYNSIIIGAGITGLSMAMWLKLRYPKEKILVCDKGMNMASRKNAGFVTSGSLKYLLNLIETNGKEKALAIWNISKKNRLLIESFINKHGISKTVQYQKLGSITFLESKKDVSILKSIGFKEVEDNPLSDLVGLIDPEESSFNPIRFHDFLLNFVISLGVEVDFNSEVKEIVYKKPLWQVKARVNLKSKKLLIATNDSFLLNKIIKKDNKIVRTRAQIQSYKLSFKIENSSNIYLPSKKIYYRISDNKLIIGGLRGVDPLSEITDKLGINDKIQDALKEFVFSNIDKNAKLENQWSGIMGMRENELPLVYVDRKKSLYFLGGYSGHGNAFAFYLALKIIDSMGSDHLSEKLNLFI